MTARDTARHTARHTAPHTAHTLPPHLRTLFVVFFAANLLHFIHNAEYIAFYPGIPTWMTRQGVYLAWVAGVSVGLIGLWMVRSKFSKLGLALIAAYGAQGLDGLAHYSLALCAEHTLATNLTIWLEVVSGFCLLLAAALWIGRLLARPAPKAR
jgi:hypothetical protein